MMSGYCFLRARYWLRIGVVMNDGISFRWGGQRHLPLRVAVKDVSQPGGIGLVGLLDTQAGLVECLAQRHGLETSQSPEPVVELLGKLGSQGVVDLPQGTDERARAGVEETLRPAAQLGEGEAGVGGIAGVQDCLLYTSPSPRD